MSRPVPIFEAVYLGGATPFIGELNYTLPNTQFVFQNFDTDDATIELLYLGAADYTTITFDDDVTVFSRLNEPLVGFRISALAEGSYKITAYQW